MRRSPLPAFAGLAAVFALCGCGAATAVIAPAAAETTTHDISVSATFTDTPSGTAPSTAITYDSGLVHPGARVAISSRSDTSGTTVKFAVRGLLPNRHYGAHIYTKACGVTGDAAGPHYQNSVDPVQPSVDPRYANPQNEIWLDFTTDPAGAATSEATVPWQFADDRRAQSVVVHARGTAIDAGRAGDAGGRAACVSVPFQR